MMNADSIRSIHIHLLRQYLKRIKNYTNHLTFAFIYMKYKHGINDSARESKDAQIIFNFNQII